MKQRPATGRVGGWLLWLGFCAGLGAALPVAAAEEDRSARFESIGDLESIPDGVVTALAQGAAGYLWIGSTRGLIRYDGYGFRRHLHDEADPQSIGGNLIRSLLLARDGRLWVGTDADGLSVYNPRSERFVGFRHRPNDPASLPPGPIMALAEDRDGRIWIGTRGGGLASLDPATGHAQRFRDGREGELAPRADFIYALRFDAAGALWIGTRAGLRRMASAGAPREAVRSAAGDPSGLDEETVYSLLEPGDGRLWIGTQSGRLLLLDPQTLAVTPAPDEAGVLQPGDPQDRLDTVSAMLRVDSGDVWLGRSSGIEVREPGSARLLRFIRHDPARPTGLAGNEVRELLQDRSGLLWVGGFGGGVQWHDPNNRWARVLRGEPGHGGVFSQPDIASILERRNGEIWLGTRGRGIAILDAQLRLIGGLAPESSHGEGLGVGWITAMAEDASGRVWLGSRVGLRRYDPSSGELLRFGSEHGLQSTNVRRLFLDREGDLWIGSGDGLYRLPAAAQAIERLQLTDGAPLLGEFNTIQADADGALWFGASTGLYRHSPSQRGVQRIDSAAEPTLSHPSVVGLLVDSQDRLWIDTVDGLFRLRERSPPWAFDPVSARLGLEGDYGANLLEDASGRIWSHRYVYTPDSDGLYALSPGDGVEFGTGWFRSYLRTRDGRLLFGGSLGLLEIQPKHFRPWSYQPPLVLTELRIADQLQPVNIESGRLLLEPGQRSLAVEFAALDFSAPRRLRYAYRLLGVDDDWVATAADRRVAAYRNLSPGRYRLQIRASPRSGEWSAQEIDLPVEVRPQWWQTRSFVLLAIIAGGLLIGFLLRLRLNFLRRQSLALEALVQRRTQELSQAKARAERAFADLELAKDQLVEAEKMASLGALVAGVAHEINTPLGIAVTAASHLRDQARQSSRRLDDGTLTRGELRHWQRTVEEGNALVLGNLERAGRLVSSFKRVAVDQSSEERRRFELRGFLDEVRTALLPGFRRSGYVLDVECAPGIELDTYPGALFQIFTNLVNNALIHAFDGRDGGRMRIVARRFGNEVELRFSDDGNGMAADIASRAFDPFFTTRRSEGGSGLGLHLVYNLVTQLLRGRIELRTSPGAGCEFVMRLPVLLGSD